MMIKMHQTNIAPLEELTDAHFELMRVPRRFQTAVIERVPPSIRGEVESWIANVRKRLADGMGLLFTGEYGVGKSAAATLCLMAARKHYAPSMFVNAAELLEAKLTGRRIDDEPLWERVHHQDVLLIDDLGKEGATRGALDSEVWDRLLQLRGDRMLTTLVTSNLTIDALEERYGPSFMERVRESFIVVEAEGPNQRLTR